MISQPASLELSSFDSASSLAHGDNFSNKKSITHPISHSEDVSIPPPPPMGMAYNLTSTLYLVIYDSVAVAMSYGLGFRSRSEE